MAGMVPSVEVEQFMALPDSLKGTGRGDDPCTADEKNLHG
jgi:hypothetical protein